MNLGTVLTHTRVRMRSLSDDLMAKSVQKILGQNRSSISKQYALAVLLSATLASVENCLVICLHKSCTTTTSRSLLDNERCGGALSLFSRCIFIREPLSGGNKGQTNSTDELGLSVKIDVSSCPALPETPRCTGSDCPEQLRPAWSDVVVNRQIVTDEVGRQEEVDVLEGTSSGAPGEPQGSVEDLRV